MICKVLYYKLMYNQLMVSNFEWSSYLDEFRTLSVWIVFVVYNELFQIV